MKIIDWVLVVVILATVAFLGHRLLAPKTEVAEPAQVAAPVALAPAAVEPIRPLVATSTPVPVSRTANVNLSINSLSQLKSLSAEQWKSLTAPEGIAGVSVQETEGCAMKNRLRDSLNLFVRQQAARIGQRDLNLSLGYRGPACYKVGTNLEILSFDAEIRYPVAESHGTARIVEIISIPARSIDTLLGLVGLPRVTYDFLLETYFKAKLTENEFILRLEPLSASTARTDIPPKAFPNVRVLTLAEARAAVQAKRAVIVDVRSADEFSRYNIPGSINVPYTLAEGLSMDYTPSVPKSKLLKSSFDQTRIVGIDPNLQVIIVGRSSRDSRPHFALYDVYRLGLASIGWIYDGITEPPKAK